MLQIPSQKWNKRNAILCVCISESVTCLSGLSRTGIEYQSTREATVEKEWSCEGFNYMWLGEFQRCDCIVVGRKETQVREKKSSSRWVRAKWGVSDVTGRGREWAGLNRLKLLQHLLGSSKADKRVLFKEATTLWETLDLDCSEPV